MVPPIAGQVETYLPLHVGDSWTYVNDIGATRTFSVNAEREIDGRTYYEFDDYFAPCGFPGWSEEDDSSHLFRHDPEYRLQSYSVVPEPQISLALPCTIFIGTVAFCRRSAMILPTSSVSLAAVPSRHT